MAAKVELKVKQKTDGEYLSSASLMGYFEQVIYQIQHGLAIMNDVGAILLCNTAFESVVLHENAGIDLKMVLKIATSSERDLYESRVSSPIGNYKVSFQKLKGDDGIRWLCQLWPMEQKPAKDRAVRLKKLYCSFVDNMFELVFRTSPDDSLIFANLIFVRQFGFQSIRKTKGKPFLFIFNNPDDYFKIKEKVIVQGKVTGQKVILKKADGELLTVMVNCMMYSEEETDEVYFNWTALDISEWEDYDDRLRTKTDQLAKANAQVEKFLYSTSHDLRSPITTILGLVNLMRMETRDKEVLEYVSKIEQSVNVLDHIIHDIMNFSKASYQRMSSVKINFNELIQKTIDKQRDLQSFPVIHMNIKVNGDYYFYSDPDRLEMIVGNILSNAFNFCDGNKARSFIHINVNVSPEQAVMEFIDNGIGIGKPFLENIFNMFYKASHLSRGAGLGLFIVKEAITQLKGTITVESEIGFGSLFRVIIPNNAKGVLMNRKRQLGQ